MNTSVRWSGIGDRERRGVEDGLSTGVTIGLTTIFEFHELADLHVGGQVWDRDGDDGVGLRFNFCRDLGL